LKRLPFFRRPRFARRVLEVGGGHNPYAGVTHTVDKFPEDNSQRAGDLVVARGVEFREGDLESIPFPSNDRFDFIYVSHVFEHVRDPRRAVSEINRVARAGYLETPSPLREQMACPFPFQAERDFHTLYCWTSHEANTLHVVLKTAERVGEFCKCAQGRLAHKLMQLQHEVGSEIESFLPRDAKSTVLYFSSPLQYVIHPDFESACEAGSCAYQAVNHAIKWSTFPWSLVSPRFKRLRAVLA